MLATGGATSLFLHQRLAMAPAGLGAICATQGELGHHHPVALPCLV